MKRSVSFFSTAAAVAVSNIAVAVHVLEVAFAGDNFHNCHIGQSVFSSAKKRQRKEKRERERETFRE